MKKILVFFISIFLYCATPSFVKAESGVITENEVADLLNSAWKLFETVSQNAEGYIDKSGDPISLERDGRMVAYLPAKSEYAEYTYWEELAKKIYTEDIYKYAIEQGAGSGYTLGLLTEHQGKAYFLKNDSLEVLTEGGSDRYFGWFNIDADDVCMEATDEAKHCWIDVNGTSYARGGFCFHYDESRENAAARTIRVSVEYTKTSNGWRISGGDVLDWLCPTYGNTDGKIRCLSYSPHASGYGPPLYSQIAEQVIEEELSIIFKREIKLDSVKVWFSGAYNTEKHVGTAIVTSKQINGGKAFIVSLLSESLFDNWKMDLNDSLLCSTQCNSDEIDPAPLKELFAASTNTSDVTDLVLPFSVCVLALSADIVFRKIKESIICRYKRNMV